VLPELPDVIHDKHVINLSDKHRAEYKKAEDDIVEYLVQRAKEIALEIGKSPYSAAVVAKIKAESNVHLVKLSVLRRLAAKGKMESIKEWVQTQVEAGEKVVIAAHHRDVVDYLANEFGGLKIQGGMDVEDVEKAKKMFQNLSTEEAPVIVLSMQAAKTGHTLTAAQKVLFVELPWTPADVDQLYSRCHRLGQKGSVMVTYAIAVDTVDEQIYDLIQSKRHIVNAAVDGSYGEESESSSQLVLDYLKRGFNR
jgi:SWI/SNF-related matrix-associated actin-dependent regulator 1 of chromatin subfamily A